MSILTRLSIASLSSDQLLFLGRISEASERYHDMTIVMAELVKNRCRTAQQISIEERNLLSVAYKMVISRLRASWRAVSDSEQMDLDDSSTHPYKKIIEFELQCKCDEILSLLRSWLLVQYKDAKDEHQVFYMKMAGDYCRYLAELDTSSHIHAQEAQRMYSSALQVAGQCLSPTHPVHLGLCLNAAVLYYEILQQPRKACELAKTAFERCIENLDTINNDASYKDSTKCMQLLRDNLSLWASSQNTQHIKDDEEDDDDDTAFNN